MLTLLGRQRLLLILFHSVVAMCILLCSNCWGPLDNPENTPYLQVNIKYVVLRSDKGFPEHGLVSAETCSRYFSAQYKYSNSYVHLVLKLKYVIAIIIIIIQ